MMALAWKDLRVLFASPLAAVTLALFLFLTGFAFSSQLDAMSPGQLPEASMRGMIYFMAIILLFVLPLLTMRSFADESRLQTMELLRTAPISDTRIVVAKFLGVWIFLSILILSTLIYPLCLYLFAKPDTGPLFMGYLGLWLLGSSFIAIGLLASSVVRSPLLAALLSFVSLLVLWFIGGVEAKWAAQLSLIRHLESFSIGVFDIGDTVYYLVAISIFLFLTIRWQEASRWK